MSKVMTIEQAVDPLKNGQSIMVSGFGGLGSPHSIIDGIVEKGINDLTIICNDAGKPNFGVGRFFANRTVKKLLASFIGPNPQAGEMFNNHEVEIDLIPQGTLAESIRSGGAGLGGILTKTGIGTLVQGDKQLVTINNETYMVEPSIKADVAIVYAQKADTLGNLVYKGASRAHGPNMATAADYVIAEVEEIVEAGMLSPEEIHTQSIFVDAVVLKVGK